MTRLIAIAVTALVLLGAGFAVLACMAAQATPGCLPGCACRER